MKVGMENYYERTDIGGHDGRFQNTCWTMIMQARTTNQERESLLVDQLLSRYWKPVYCYLRRKGYQNETAKDLTQGFFIDVVLQRDLLKQAEPGKGRFRTFLLSSLKRYVVDVHRVENAEKRRPKGQMLALDDMEISRIQASPQDDSAEACFTKAWMEDLFERVLTEVKDECIRSGKEAHWQLFEFRVLTPILTCDESPSLPVLCDRLHVDDVGRASNMIITVKRRLKKTMTRHLSQLGDGDSEVLEEIRALQLFLEK